MIIFGGKRTVFKKILFLRLRKISPKFCVSLHLVLEVLVYLSILMGLWKSKI
jgi:hypothetical protein